MKNLMFKLSVIAFYPRDAVLARHMLCPPCVRLSVCHKSSVFSRNDGTGEAVFLA